MSVIVILILASLTLALIFLGGFVWAVKSGQFEDTTTPSMRVLTDEQNGKDQSVGNQSREMKHRNFK